MRQSNGFNFNDDYSLVVNETYTLRFLREGDIGETENRSRFIVEDRYPEDRVSGISEVRFSDGSKRTYVWDDSDPLVRYLGKGKLFSSFEIRNQPLASYVALKELKAEDENNGGSRPLAHSSLNDIQARFALLEIE